MSEHPFLKWVGENMKDEYRIFTGPCAHGRDPYDRCDICGELPPEQARDMARIAELEARLETMKAELVRWADGYEGLAAARTKSRAQALEEAAKVAANSAPEWDRDEIADAIRNLKGAK